MTLLEEQYMKFPVLLRKKLQNNEIELPDSTQFRYEKIKVYRAVARKADDNKAVSLDDFKSYAELGKKAPRGRTYDVNDPHYYGVSTFMNKEIVEQKLCFPNPNKKMTEGFVYQEGGPQETKAETSHVCWWLYEGVDVSGFEII